MEVKYAGQEKIDEYVRIANEWFANSPTSWRFGDVKSSARLAIIEFLANQDGLSVYTDLGIWKEKR